MGLPPAGQDPTQVRDLADEILSDPRYDRPAKPLVERVLDWAGEQLSEALAALVGSGGGTILAWLLLLGALGAVVYLLVRHGRVTLPARLDPPRPDVMIETTRTAAQWRAEAETLEAAGRWEEGLRCRYRALVADLVRRGVIPEQPGRTAGEHVRDVVAAAPDAAPSFAAATELFEAVWYGGATAGPDDARRFADLDRQVLAVRVP